MSNQEYYPTPFTLAFKAYNKFKNKTITRLLEPSAGRGALLEPFISSHHTRTDNIDCVEVNLDNQAVLRGKKLNVIDGDFLQSELHSLYSHVIMNPPFSNGDAHVLKAFSIIISGELVAILNAETIRNPHTSKRKQLVKLIEDHGSVEYIDQAFTDPDTLRKTTVEIALIHLEKKVDLRHNFTNNLETDKPTGIHYEQKQELAIKNSTISNAIALFNAAVNALRSAEIAQEESNYYTALLGKPLNQQIEDKDIDPQGLYNRFNKGYDDLKKRAWNNVLHSTEFNKYLSSKAYQQLVNDFEQVSKLSFTESNIRGFLLGLVQGQGEMNMSMLLDCFDEITKYRPENRAYYRGWKSNEKHREQAYRVQMTRFIIPANGYSWNDSVSTETLNKLKDFDKVFSMLAGKASSIDSLHQLFYTNKGLLKNGNRVSTDFFDVRYYPGASTIHFFPTDKKTVERLNLLVGRERSWLPEDDNKASKAFWKQYNSAEKITKEMIVKVSKWGRLEDDDETLINAHQKACDILGYDTSNLLN